MPARAGAFLFHQSPVNKLEGVMGQLEKYGLYVLCLVIFLILGVTIWGGGDMPAGKSPTASIHAPNNTAATNARTNPANGSQRLPALAELLEAGDNRGNAPPATPGANGNGNAGSGGSGGTPSGAAKDVAKNEPKGEPKAPKAEPREATPAVYKVQEGDTFASIAATKLGKASLVDDLMRLNPAVDPRKMRPGTELKLPNAAAVAEADSRKPLEKPISPASDGSRTYFVKKGDNFERIAKAELGSIKRRDELAQLNANVDPLKLKPGMSLKLPPK